MNRTLRNLIALTLILSSGMVFGQDRGPKLSEKTIRVPRVDFVNRARRMRRSPRRVRVSQYRRGRALARQVARSGKGDVRGYIIERVYSPTSEKLGADIMTIKGGTTYGHIAHIQRILAAYIQQSFEYKYRDALLLSRFVLYYNARQRGNIEGVKKVYSEVVVAKLDPRKVGIARVYRDWAGKTQLLLPLTKSLTRKGNKTLDPDEIRKNAGKVTPRERKAIKDLVRRRNNEDKKALLDKQRKIKKDQKEVTKKKGELKKQLKKLDKKIAKMRKDPKRNQAEIKRALKKRKEIKKAEKKVAKVEKKLKKEEKKVAKEIKKVTKKQEEEKKPAKKSAATTEKKPVSKPVDKKKLTKEITKKVKKEIEKKKNAVSKSVIGTRILFLRVLKYFNGGHYNNELWFIDAAKDDALFRGPFTKICGRSFLVIPKAGILIIGYRGESHADTGHKLILLNPKTLAVEKATTTPVFWRTFMISKDDKIYAILAEKDAYYLARFNKDLTLDRKSDKVISPDTDITFYNDKIYLTGRAKAGQPSTIRVVRRNDLKILKTIKPGQ